MQILTMNRIDAAAMLAEVSTPESGGTDVFVGTTRNHSAGRQVAVLEYEAYEPMALKIMAELEREAMRKWPLHKVALVHRLGKVPVGEASVLVAVSGAHRNEAFEACRFLIDSLKREVPIWKKEFFADGAVEWSGQSGQLLQRAHR